MTKKYQPDTEMTIIPVTVEETKATKLALRFIGEALAVIAPFDRIYADAYDELKYNYFASLQPFVGHDDFNGQHPLACPGYLDLFVGPHTLFGWFRAWLRKQGIDPETLTIPHSYPFTASTDAWA